MLTKSPGRSCFPCTPMLLAAMLAPGAAHAQHVRYVDASAAPGGDGSTWATAFDELREALAAAAADASITQVWIAEGTYAPASRRGSRTATFQLRNGLAIYGGFEGGETALGQRDITANVVTLSGDLNANDPASFTGPPPASLNDNSFHVINGSGVNASAVLDGVTVRGGSAHGPGATDREGGGLVCIAGAPTIVHCTFMRNFSADRGGAVYCAANSPATFAFCTFDSNRTTLGSGSGSPGFGGGAILLNASNAVVSDCAFQGNGFAPGADGGAVLSMSSSPQITRCTFLNNGEPGTFTGSGGAVRLEASGASIFDCRFTGNRAAGGGSISIVNSHSLIRHCIFERGTASFHAEGGGAISVVGPVPPRIVDCLFDRISAEAGGALANSNVDTLVVNCLFTGNSAYLFDGGAVTNTGDAAPTFVNCAFTGNRSTSASGGSAAISHDSTSPMLAVNCTFASNAANPRLPGGAAVTGANAALRNCIVVHNTPNQLHSSVAADWSCIQGGWPGFGNVNASNPGFADENGDDDVIGTPDDDVRLMAGSPCIDAARNADVPADTADLDGDGNTLEPTPLDLALQARFRDDAATTDTGVGPPPVVDMGCFEFQLNCPADISNDGTINVTDLLAVIGGWGTCPGACPPHCSADIAPADGDCAVNVTDLLAVISDWGACR